MAQPQSVDWLAALGTSHGVATRVEVWYAGQPVDTLDVDDGTVKVDRGSARRRTCDVTVPDPSRLPLSPTDRLAPYGVRLRPYRGIVLAGGQIEWMPLGDLRVQDAEGERGIGPVQLSAESMECALDESKIRSPRSSAGMGTAVAAITTLITEVIPDAVVTSRATGDRAIPTVVWDAQATRLEMVGQLARAIGAEVYPDATGTWVVEDTPDVATQGPVWEVREGVGGTMIRSVVRMSREGIRNGILATGSNTSDGAAGVSGWARDENPASPTWYYGPFGQVDGVYSSPLLTTTGECEKAARSVLLDRLGPNLAATLDVIPNPALEAGDCVLVTYEDGARELAIVQSISIGLSPGAGCTIALRSQTDAPEGLS